MSELKNFKSEYVDEVEAIENEIDLEDRRLKSKLSIFNDRFFPIMEKNKTQIKAKCTSCQQILSGHEEISSNFLKHMKRKHPAMMLDYNQFKITKRTDTNTSKSQLTKLKTLQPIKNILTQKIADDLISNFIIKSMLPMDTVETKEFKDLIHGLSNGTVEVMSKVTLARRIDALFSRTIEEYQSNI
ncbi:unnamed protein product [Gordionus sp. m RMFG-2023]